jgi:PAS domain S-box-containing protein
MTTALTATEYQLLVQHSPMMIWRAGRDARCDYFNETWLAFTGRSLQEEVGNGWTEGVHEADIKGCIDHYLDHFQQRQPFEMEYRLRRRDGVYRWIFDRGVPYTNDLGEFAGFIGSCVDVEERRRARDERELQAREELALARQFEHWVLTIVSDDIGHPLGAIQASAKLLAAAPGGDEQLRNVVERISRSAERITNVVDRLLDLSRARHRGHVPIGLSETDLHLLYRDIAQEIARTATGARKFTE